MPLGSSSAAPVMSPGPSCLQNDVVFVALGFFFVLFTRPHCALGAVPSLLEDSVAIEEL